MTIFGNRPFIALLISQDSGQSLPGSGHDFRRGGDHFATFSKGCGVGKLFMLISLAAVVLKSNIGIIGSNDIRFAGSPVLTATVSKIELPWRTETLGQFSWLEVADDHTCVV